jgi:N-acyl-D-amino-acid deacylase
MKKIIITYALLLSTAIVFAQSAAQVKTLDSALTYLHERDMFNGTALFAENGKILYKKAFGTANIATKEPLRTNSAFNLASISKQFFCMMVMILQEQGKLNYDDKVQKHLPDFPYDTITIRHLMTHTSGVPEYFDVLLRHTKSTDTINNAEMIAVFKAVKPALDFKTGEKWNYSNTNYVYLASLIEQVSGQKVATFFQERIVKPLGLKETYIYNLDMPTSPKNRVYGFKYLEGKQKLDDLTRFDGIVGDGNIYSSVEDLLVWEQSFSTEKLVKQSTIKEALTPVKLNYGTTYNYGFGWFIQPDSTGKTGLKVSHTGGWAGFRNLISRYVDKKQTLILLCSNGGFEQRKAAEAIVEGKPLTLPQTHLIKNVRIVDGTGTPAYAGSVRVMDNRIAEIGDLKPFKNEPYTEGGNQVLAPGFIDSHSHHDWYLMEKPDALAALNQGITTIIVGQDGGGTRMDTIEGRIKKTPIAVNLATYTGHTLLREITMGGLRGALFRAATAKEIDQMKVLMDAEMDKGSLGLATGLEYESAFHSRRDEVLQLAKVAAAKGGRYISHIRSEDTDIDDAFDEIISIGRECKMPVQVSHIKVSIKSKWGYSRQVLAQLQAARAEGIDITADCYPYDFWQSTLRILFPKRDYTNPVSAEYAMTDLVDPAGSYVVRYKPNPQYAGKSLTEIAKMRNETPAKALLYLIATVDDYEQKHPEDEDTEGVMGKAMSEEDLSNFLAWSHTNICSDGANEGHPRGYGAFTRVLARYVRDKKLLTLENAIHKMTGLTAEHLGLQNRGIIAKGNFADLVLFNPDTVQDNAVIGNNTALSTGVEAVWVNGEMVYKNQKSMGKFSGVLIKKGN